MSQQDNPFVGPDEACRQCGGHAAFYYGNCELCTLRRFADSFGMDITVRQILDRNKEQWGKKMSTACSCVKPSPSEHNWMCLECGLGLESVKWQGDYKAFEAGGFKPK